MISDNSLPWMNVKRTSSFAPSQPSLSLQGCWNRGWLGRFCWFLFNHVCSWSIMFVNVGLCLLMSVQLSLFRVRSCLFLIVHVSLSLFKPVHFVSCFFIFVHACLFCLTSVHFCSFLFIFVHFCSFWSFFTFLSFFCFLFFFASLLILVLVFARIKYYSPEFSNLPTVMASFWMVGRRSKTNLYNDVSLK